MGDKFKLPPINFKDTTRCVFKSSAMGQANGARDTLADFRQCSMNGKSADGFDLAGAIMSEADFTSASFRETVMSKAYARDSKFTNADFSNGVVDRVSFDGSDLRGANLEGADFSEAFIGDFELRNICKNPTLSGENAK